MSDPHPSSGPYAALPNVGAPVPDFELPTLDHGRVSAASLAGHPAVLALWASRCAAARESAAALGALAAAYAPRGVRVVVLADDVDSPALRAHLGGHAPLTAAAAGGTLARIFGRRSLLPWARGIAFPSFLVLDAGGHVVARQVGVEVDAAHRLDRLRAALDTLLGLTL